jgi:hypothetical protein
MRCYSSRPRAAAGRRFALLALFANCPACCPRKGREGGWAAGALVGVEEQVVVADDGRLGR